MKPGWNGTNPNLLASQSTRREDLLFITSVSALGPLTLGMDLFLRNPMTPPAADTRPRVALTWDEPAGVITVLGYDSTQKPGAAQKDS